MADYAKEGGHWYQKDGEPAYTQITASGANKGKERPTTIRDARKHDLLPSVTTICGIVAKPALTNWMVDQGIMSALTSPHVKAYEAGEIDEKALLRLVKADSREQAKKAAERGSEIHGWIEEWYRDPESMPDGQPWCTAAHSALCDVLGDFPESMVEMEKSVAAEDYAGKVDFHSRELNAVVDFKTKDGDVEGTKAYDEQCAQLAAYAHALGMPDATLANVFISRDNPQAYVHVWSKEEADRGWEWFCAAKQLWKVANKF